jgi:RNA polymerase sigma-70 factor (ECF subfamily)
MTGGSGRPHASEPLLAAEANGGVADAPGEAAPDPNGTSPAKGNGLKIATEVSGVGSGRPQGEPQTNGPAAVADETLVQRLRGGDLPAGEVLVRRHYEALMRYLQRLAGAQVAEELHQQTWVSVLDHIDRFDPATAGGGFKAWLFRIATNKANDHWRSRGRESVAKEGLKLITDEELPDAARPMESSEQEEKLRKAIDLLPENQRQVLVLRYYGNLKFVDIAEILGCPLNTALGRMHKAILKLRQIMSDD